MPLFQPSFRGRLRLFFAVIVLVPMIAVGIVLFQLLDAGGNFKLDSGLDQAQKTAKAIYREDQQAAIATLQPIASSSALAMAIDKEDAAAVQEQLAQLASRLGSKWIALEVDGWRTFETGSKVDAVAAAQASLDDAKGQPKGTITASSTTAERYAADVQRLTGVDARVEHNGDVLASTLATAKDAEMPAEPGADVTIADVDYRTTYFSADEPDPPPVIVRLLTKVPQRGNGATIVALGTIIGFLALAFVFAVIVSR